MEWEAGSAMREADSLQAKTSEQPVPIQYEDVHARDEELQELLRTDHFSRTAQHRLKNN